MSQHKAGYTLIFMSIVAISCSLLLSATETLLGPRKAYNRTLEQRQNILKAMGILKPGMDARQVDAIFTNIKAIAVNEQGAILDGVDGTTIKYADELKKTDSSSRRYPVFILQKNGRPAAYAFPILGKGLWSMLYGYLALNPDLKTICGLTFYKQEETPGLGAEIEKDWFQAQFKGKSIYTAAGKLVGIRVIKGKAINICPNAEALSHTVDGISGATITSSAVDKLLLANLKRYQPYFDKLRQEAR